MMKLVTAGIRGMALALMLGGCGSTMSDDRMMTTETKRESMPKDMTSGMTTMDRGTMMNQGATITK